MSVPRPTAHDLVTNTVNRSDRKHPDSVGFVKQPNPKTKDISAVTDIAVIKRVQEEGGVPLKEGSVGELEPYVHLRQEVKNITSGKVREEGPARELPAVHQAQTPAAKAEGPRLRSTTDNFKAASHHDLQRQGSAIGLEMKELKEPAHAIAGFKSLNAANPENYKKHDTTTAQPPGTTTETPGYHHYGGEGVTMANYTGKEMETVTDDGQKVTDGKPEEHHKKKIPGPTEAEQRRELHFAGRLLLKLGFFLYPLVCIIPLALVIILYAVIPVHGIDDHPFHRTAIFTFLHSPVVFTLVAYLNGVLFLGCIGYARPFRGFLLPLVAVYLIECAVFSPIIPFTGYFRFFGVAAFGLAIILFYVSILAYRVLTKNKEQQQIFLFQFRKYSKLVILQIVWLAVLIAYIFGFRYLEERPVLAFTDYFPIELGMLISGLWFESMNDFFQIMAYPNIRSPGTYALIWGTNFLTNLMNLAFLTRAWFSFRLWIKHYGKNFFTCHCRPFPPNPGPDETENPDERGHSPNRNGYRRRQIRFLFFKFFGQALAMCLYLTLTPILRWGVNKHSYIFSDDRVTLHDYRNSLIYAGINLVFILIVTLLSFLWINWQYKKNLLQVAAIMKKNLTNLNYLGYVIAIWSFSGLLAVAIVMKQMQIWWAWDRGCLDVRGRGSTYCNSTRNSNADPDSAVSAALFQLFDLGSN